MKNLNPAVVIKAEDTYYLYPKNKRNNAKLVKLDNVGYLFYKKMVECSTKEEVIAEICKKFNVVTKNEKEIIEEDFQVFEKKLADVDIVIDERFKQTNNKKEKGDISEKKYIDELVKVHRIYFKKKIPFKYFVELTYNCNLRCEHCYRGEDINSDRKFMKKEVVFLLLDEMEQMGAVEVTFTGGECFTHPDILAILEYAARKNLIITVLTNGNFIREEILEHLKKISIFEIRISIYGMQEKHDSMTGVQGSWQKSVNALIRLQQEMQNATAVFVVTQDNIEESDKVLSFFKERGINVSLNTMITPTARGNLKPTQMRISISQYEELMRKNKLPITGSRCTAGISRIRISPNGDVIPCELISNHIFGNVNKQSLQEIIAGKERIKFNQEYENMLSKHVCTTKCPNRELCNFCPALSLIENNSFMKPVNYVCEMTRVKTRLLNEREREA